ncbi:hypothetical protein LSTR_LSTR006049 [Laodelphax striatellus]|uniref:C3H1-type domain-containing protein n=1 Tax=Laodelphax striatellus TaxID=195883 RepID=A0A482XNP7_LAOST|nr:hypothetical protein LSTR_LSTR006049 [Laodelphax striatellus]
MSPAHVPASSAFNDFDLLWLQSQSGLTSPLGSSSSSLASGVTSPTVTAAGLQAAVELQLMNKMALLRWNQQQQDPREREALARRVSAQPFNHHQPAANLHRRVERTQSEPNRSSNTEAAVVNTSRYKTELCRPYEENGFCKYGDKCQFAHGEGDMRLLSRHPKYKTELCRTFHTDGICPYGSRCHFIHSEELRQSALRAAAARPSPLDLRASSVCSSPASSLGSGSPPPSAFSANTAFTFNSPVRPLSPLSPCTPIGYPRSSSPFTEARLPVFNEISRNQLECLMMLSELNL